MKLMDKEKSFLNQRQVTVKLPTSAYHVTSEGMFTNISYSGEFNIILQTLLEILFMLTDFNIGK